MLPLTTSETAAIRDLLSRQLPSVEIVEATVYDTRRDTALLLLDHGPIAPFRWSTHSYRPQSGPDGIYLGHYFASIVDATEDYQKRFSQGF